MSAVNVVAAPERFNASVLLDRNIDRGRAGKAAVHGVDRSLTYGELLARASRAGNLLRALGVAREERVLLVLDDTPAFPTVFLGAMRLGAVPVPVSPLDKADNFRHFLDDSYARVVVGDAGCVPMLREVLDGRDLTFVSARGPADGALDARGRARRRRRRARPRADPPRRHGLLALQLGLDRAAEGRRPPAPRHRDHLRDLRPAGSRHPRGRRHVLDDEAVPRLRPGQRPVLPAAVRGDRGAQRRPADAGRACSPTLREHRPTVFFSVPALYGAIVRAPGAEDAFSLGADVRVGRRAAPTRGLPPLRGALRPARSSTGSAPPRCSTSTARTAPGASCAGRTGRPVPGYELRIVDEDGRALDGPAVGDLEVRGDSCAAFYWHQHEKTKAAMQRRLVLHRRPLPRAPTTASTSTRAAPTT